jgi:kinesin family protein 4/21/27
MKRMVLNANNDDDENDEVSNIQVAIRIRPDNSSHSVLHAHSNPPSIHIGSPPSKSFYFDLAFPPSTSQKTLYEDAVKPLVQQCCEGYNTTVLAYGQTGSGKTHTMLGPTVEESSDSGNDHPINYCSSSIIGMDLSQAGVIPRAIKDLFHTLEQLKKQRNSNNTTKEQYTYEIRVQFLELYGEAIHDLLSSSKKHRLVIRDGTHTLEPEVIGASEVTVTSPEDALFYMSRGMLRRITGTTAMNSESSRSHAILSLIVEQHSSVIWGENSNDNDDAENDKDNDRSTDKSALHSSEVEIKRSKFHFVDLAGSERQKKSLATGIRLKEGIEINKGLLVLGNVISALGDPARKGQHVPYRDSKLTRLLKGSLGGNHRTLMIACVSPTERNIEESINSLRYANRAKNIQNKAVLNIDASAGSELVKILKQRVKDLAKTLLVYVEADEHDISETNANLVKTFTVSELKRLSTGDEIDRKIIHSYAIKQNKNIGHGSSEGTAISTTAFESTVFTPVGGFKSELENLNTTTEHLRNELKIKSEELFAAKAEVEYYKLHISDDLSNDQCEKVTEKPTEIKKLYLKRMEDYERENESLRQELRYAKAQITHGHRSNMDVMADTYDSNQPLMSNTMDDKHRHEYLNDEDEEDLEICALTHKYTKAALNDLSLENDEDSHEYFREFVPIKEADENEKFVNLQSQLDEQVILLSKDISAKEDLIQQLEKSQRKYVRMKAFYEEKLKKMSLKLSVQEAEKTSLETELQKYSKNSKKYIDLEEALAKKEKYISRIKKRQVEIQSLTSVASKNEAVIFDLTNEISKMKIQRDDLQKQLLKERKTYTTMLRKMEKKSITQIQDLSKMREQLDTTLAQKHRVEDMARSRGVEIVKLRDQYKKSEKRLRMQTLKRGILERSGVDQIMIGRYDKKPLTSKTTSYKMANNPISFSSNDIIKMRKVLQDHVTELSKIESTADLLAKEFSDHLELCTRKASALERRDHQDDLEIKDEIESLDFQIQYKESRIRKLAARLDRSKLEDDNIVYAPSKDHVIDDRIFKDFKGLPHITVLQLAVKVLFGMVIQERRRVTSLAITASNLDTLSAEASKRASSSKAALKSLIEEHKNERVALIQNYQEKILSLMEMVHDNELQPRNAKVSDQHPISMDLRLANERIEILEDQLAEMEDERAVKESFQIREQEILRELEKMTSERNDLSREFDILQRALIKMKEHISALNNDDQEFSTMDLLSFIQDTLSGLETKEQHEHLVKHRHTLESNEEDLDNESESLEWASSIMEDLAIIAAGKVPVSMQPRGENLSQLSQRNHKDIKSMKIYRDRTNTPTSYEKSTVSSSNQECEFSFSPKRKSLPDRISNIIKVSSHANFDEESIGPRSASSARGSKSSQKSDVAGKDVFERLQKKHTNSFTNRNSDSISRRT